MRTIAVASAIAALSVVPATTAAPALSQSSTTFRLANNTVGCHYLAGAIACRNRSGAPALMVMQALDAPRPMPKTLVSFNRSTPVLTAGTSWQRNGLTCQVRAGGIWCRNTIGAEIGVSASGFAAVAAADSSEGFATGG